MAVNCVHALVIASSTHARNCLERMIFMITSNLLMMAISCTVCGTVNGSVACAVTRLKSAKVPEFSWKFICDLGQWAPVWRV